MYNSNVHYRNQSTILYRQCHDVYTKTIAKYKLHTEVIYIPTIILYSIMCLTERGG